MFHNPRLGVFCIKNTCNMNFNSFKYLLYGASALMLGCTLVMFIFPGHSCKWELCPYKGIHSGHYKQAVYLYTGQINTDAYKIDLLHLEHPNLDNDQLDSLLQTP